MQGVWLRELETGPGQAPWHDTDTNAEVISTTKGLTNQFLPGEEITEM